MLQPAPSAFQLATPSTGLEPGPLRARAHSTSASTFQRPQLAAPQQYAQQQASSYSLLDTHRHLPQPPNSSAGALHHTATTISDRSSALQSQLTPRLLASDHFLFQANQRPPNEQTRASQSARLSTSDQLIESTGHNARQRRASPIEREGPIGVVRGEFEKCGSKQAGSGKAAAAPDERRASSCSSSRMRGQSGGSRRISSSAQSTGGDDLNFQALELLKKRSFACTILGARQTGKRSIVLCFVKLMNEFKLAVDELRREKLISKLVECSEKLQELASKREHEHEEQRRREQRRASRLNSWLPSGETVKNLLSLSPVSKKRLHSVAGPFLNVQQDPDERGRPKDDEDAMAAGEQRDERQLHQGDQRRHTTIETPSFRLISGSDSNQESDAKWSAGDKLNELQLQRHSKLAGHNNNKSDSNINYETTLTCWPELEVSREATMEQQADDEATCSSYQLQVPSWDSLSRKHSEPNARASESANEDDEKRQAGAPNRRRRHTSNVSTVGFSIGATDADYSKGHRGESRDRAGNLFAGLPTRRASSRSVGYEASRPIRRRSICMSRRRRRILLSLKELNRRKFAIKFSTRRQVSDTLVERHRLVEQAQKADNIERVGRRKSTIIQVTGRLGTTSGGLDRNRLAPLPDAFLVVYSINDRDSFDYAKSMIEQLSSISRLLQQDVPLPIVLVANKSDLERNRQVNSEDGRAVARKYSCKFIEISCTIGFNLDNLLVGLRTQLVLKHHVLLNTILRPGFRCQMGPLTGDSRNKEPAGNQSKDERNPAKESNILMRFYKRYVMDCHEREYDCDNFSKL